MAAGKYINIYGLVSENEPNNIRYVGITRGNPNNRLNNHIYEATKHPTSTPKNIWIVSENYKIKQIILDVVDEKEGYFWEKHWISLIKSWGYNLSNSNNGGGGLSKRSKEFSEWLSNRSKGNKYNLGKKRTNEAKLKMSKAKLGKQSNRKGVLVTEETKIKQSLAKIGKQSNASGFKHSEETKDKKRKKVIQLNLKGEVLNEFNSVSETANYFSVSIPTISKVLNKNKKYKIFMFKTKIENNG